MMVESSDDASLDIVHFYFCIQVHNLCPYNIYLLHTCTMYNAIFLATDEILSGKFASRTTAQPPAASTGIGKRPFIVPDDDRGEFIVLSHWCSTDQLRVWEDVSSSCLPHDSNKANARRIAYLCPCFLFRYT